MKRIVLMIAAIAFIVSNSKAQEYSTPQETSTDFREQLLIGLKVGMNSSNVYNVQAEQFNADFKFGFVGGAFLSIPIGEFLGIQPEVLFSQKGFKTSGSILGFSYNYSRTTYFLDIPLPIQLKPAEFLTLVAGPQYSYLIKQKDVFGDVTMEQQFNNDNIRKNIFCFLGGLDLNLDHLVIGARVGWDITKNNGDGTSSNPRYKNYWYQGTVGFRF
jgi:hypothetical protein